jgi:hypothetical protein
MENVSVTLFQMSNALRPQESISIVKLRKQGAQQRTDEAEMNMKEWARLISIAFTIKIANFNQA